MSPENEMKFSLRIVMNKEKNKVLFAEVGSDFADILLSFLTLPLGTVLRLLDKHYEDEAPVIGSLNSLYQGLSNLDQSHFWTSSAKNKLLNPKNSLQTECSKLKLNFDDTEPTRYYVCENLDCSTDYNKTYVSTDKDSKCLICRKLLKSEVSLNRSYVPLQNLVIGDKGAFTQEMATFLIGDDLQLKPNAAGASLEILTNLGIRDADGLVFKTIKFGLKEIMELLKGSLVSRTPLTDIIVQNNRRVHNAVKSEPIESVPPMGKKVAFSNCRKMAVKAIVQKSTNKVLLAQADEDFVDFLFGLLWIPLGRVLYLLGTNNCLKSINNLYCSLAYFDGPKYLKSQELKDILLKPGLPPEYLSKNQMFPVNKAPGTFMVSDDLVVTPSSAISSLLVLKKLKVPFHDVEERVFDIGTKEALDLLKACLTSTSALTNALQPIPKKQPTQEY